MYLRSVLLALQYVEERNLFASHDVQHATASLMAIEPRRRQQNARRWIRVWKRHDEARGELGILPDPIRGQKAYRAIGDAHAPRVARIVIAQPLETFLVGEAPVIGLEPCRCRRLAAGHEPVEVDVFVRMQRVQVADGERGRGE